VAQHVNDGERLIDSNDVAATGRCHREVCDKADTNWPHFDPTSRGHRSIAAHRGLPPVTVGRARLTDGLGELSVVSSGSVQSRVHVQFRRQSVISIESAPTRLLAGSAVKLARRARWSLSALIERSTDACSAHVLLLLLLLLAMPLAAMQLASFVTLL